MDKGICIIPDCTKEAWTLARRWCINHDRRWKKYGDPLAGRGRNMTPVECSIDDCHAVAVALSWCLRHYTRYNTYGDPLFMKRQDPAEPLAFYHANLMVRQPQCKLWPYNKSASGYGRIQIDGVRYVVSRLACEAFNGPPPEPSWEAAHGKDRRCIATSCWNGDHLQWLPHDKNMEMLDRDVTRPRGEAVVQSKLTETDVLAIRRRRAAGESRISLAAAFDVHVEHIGLITTRRSWKHI